MRMNCLLWVAVAATVLVPKPTWAAEKSNPAPTKPANAAPENSADWKPMFDGQSLKGWKVTDFAGHGEITVDPNFKATAKAEPSAAILFEMGAVLTGITYTNPPPHGEYELALEAMKVDGSDFFCALTFPAGTGHCSLVVGGWGGGVVGISSIDGMDASENETTKFLSFDKGKWYAIRVRVTQAKIEAWIDQEKLINVDIKDRRITVRAGEIELAEPLGISAYQTKSALRNIRLRSL